MSSPGSLTELLPAAAIGTALYLGILTSISPCPLATNIAAISFIARRVGKIRAVLLSGLIYSLGRSLAYIALGWLVVSGLMASGQISRFLQQYMNQLLGPILILVGMLLLNLLSFTFSVNLASGKIQQRATETGGHLSVFLLGLLFALSFCPVSAGIFFGAVIPLAAAHQSNFWLPLIYGLGTALPVVAFSFIIAFASNRLGAALNHLSRIERVARTITGILFIVAGFYYSLRYIYGIGS